MESKFQPQKIERLIYQFWEENKLFEAKVDKKKKPFSIILPPPNANADLHLGHAMYVYEDVMIRYHKLLGEEVLWLPGADHAGFETQYVFEKQLQKEGQSRFDYDRVTLYQMIWDFVMKNRINMENQLRRLGFALDWEKKKFTLDEDIVRIVKETFKRLFDKGLVYHDEAIVNYCVNCGTSFSDLEVVYKEKEGKLWYILYPFDFINKKKGGVIVATTRPETMLGDVAVAVNPKDKRYKSLVNQTVILPIVEKKIPIITDNLVDPHFGTGAVKVTPCHDPKDWQIAKRQKIDSVLYRQVIDTNGKMTVFAGEAFQGLTISQAREKILLLLKKEALLIKEKNYRHRVGHCYKCDGVIEPLPMKQWFVKIKPLALKAKKKINKNEIKIYPKRFKKILLWWLDNFHDWNISRQIVWGIQIPAYYCNLCQKWFISVDEPKKCPFCQGSNFTQEKDTFDTWFSSGQWPYATLLTLSVKKPVLSNLAPSQKNVNDFFNYFYPTSVMETGYDILPWWVARMIMLGIFYTGRVPFKNVFLHGLVRDKYGRKMSKSKGNVISPMEMIDKYGADALRTALIFGTKEGNDQSLSEEKIIGMRNFVNKVWNIGRFIYINREIKHQTSKIQNTNKISKILKELEKEFKQEKEKYLKLMNSYRFSQALGLVYDFLWHRLADYYIEELKESLRDGNIKALESLKEVYFENLKMLHPFAPFVTEAIWKIFEGEKSSILKERLKICKI